MVVLLEKSWVYNMFQFTRTKTIGVENREDDMFMVHGFLQDNLYAIELEMKVKTPEFTILSATGHMKRYVTPECAKAPGILNDAVGLKIGEPDFEARIKMLVGRNGCRHLADLFIECCHAVFPAFMQVAWRDAESRGMPKHEFLSQFLVDTDWIKDSCRTFSMDT